MKYEIDIEGVCPMLQNRLSKELNDTKKDIKKEKLEKWEQDNWRKKLYTDDSGRVVIKAQAIYKMLQEACSKTQTRPPKHIGRTWGYYFKSSVIPLEDAVVNNAQITQLGTMVNGNPSAKGKSSKVFTIRPLVSMGWKATLSIVDLGDELDKVIVEEIASAAGKFIGVGDWRPLHGRFKINKVRAV